MDIQNKENKTDKHSAGAHTTIEQGAEILEKAVQRACEGKALELSELFNDAY